MLGNPISRQTLSVKLFFAFTAIYVIWGSTYLAIRYAVETIPPFLMMGSRSLIAGAILFLWSRLRKENGLKAEHLPSLIILGASFFLIGHGLLAWAQQKVPSGFAALLMASEPLWIALIESLAIRNSRVGIAGVLGLILGFVGMLVLIFPTKGMGSASLNIPGTIAILVGTLSWAGGAVYQRVARLPGSPVLTAGMELMIGGFLLGIAGFSFGEFQVLQQNPVSIRSAFSLGYLIVFGSLVAFTAYIWLLGKTTATRVATHTYVNPVIAIMIGWQLAGEPLSFSTVIATAIIILSVYLVLNDRAIHGSAPAVEGEIV